MCGLLLSLQNEARIINQIWQIYLLEFEPMARLTPLKQFNPFDKVVGEVVAVRVVRPSPDL
ncbi:hypothetical protein PVN28_21780 [Bacillus licheniformis]|uniref:hypothetical protein n=1 Tax=Bacillus licheniformis TaxID=1402 RepID=UPI00237D0923|nr:hypothetical protein [Bacillus licheniformis]MDE1442218.1 hypothetical protein [Bacillus licheniformis]